MKKIIFSILVLIILFIIGGFLFDWGNRDVNTVSNTHTATSTSDMLTVFSPTDGQTVTSPISVSGKVSGDWFFEGSFPVELIDSDGTVIATTTAQTPGDWATTSIINFSATLVYPKATTSDRALIMLKNDNPSGDPALDTERFIQVILK